MVTRRVARDTLRPKMLLLLMLLLVALSLAPGWPREAGSRRGGDQLLEVGGGGDLHPGGVGVDLDRDAAVLVGAVLVEAPGVLGLPHLLGQDTPPLGQLEVDEDIGVCEVKCRSRSSSQ